MEDNLVEFDLETSKFSVTSSLLRHNTSCSPCYKRNVSDEDKQLEVKKEVVVDVKQYSGVELIIKSGFGSTLPSKDDLIRTYEKI
ncbi:hypothetical protein YC2023_013049 [Brassica napus]